VRRIVTVEISDVRPVSKINDPLVIGIKKNSNIRYLIDWWDKDIDPTELIK